MNNLGNIKIADDVVKAIAAKATEDVEGVYKLAGGVADEVSKMLGKKRVVNFKRDIKRYISDTTITAAFHINPSMLNLTINPGTATYVIPNTDRTNIPNHAKKNITFLSIISRPFKIL